MTKSENYYVEQVKRPIDVPLKPVNVFGSSYVFQSPMAVVLEVQNLFSKYKYLIKGLNDEVYFRATKGLSTVLYDMNDKPLLNIRNGFTKVCLYEGKNHDEQPLVVIKNKDSTVARKFTVTYINRQTKQEETLDMNCDCHFRSAGIFMGKEKEGAPMVGKCIQTVKPTIGGEKIKYTIQIAPGIDIILIIALSIFIRIKKEGQS